MRHRRLPVGVTGLRAELSIAAAESCPVAAASATAETPLRDVTWTTDGSDGTVERFDAVGTSPATDVGDTRDETGDTRDETGNTGDETRDTRDETDDEHGADTTSRGASFDTVFDDGQTQTLEFERDWDDCVCEQIESVGCPVDDVRAVDGRLRVQFRVRSNERLREVIAAAREAATDVRLAYVVSAGDERSDAVLVDRGELTDRQREALETAYAAGYFAHPREANAETVAGELGVSPATFREHLAAAQSKLFGAVLDG